MKRLLVFLILALLGFVTGCGGGANSPVTTNPQAGMASINFGDATNDQIIEFEVTVGAITLTGSGNPSILSKPVEFEFVHNSGAVEPVSVLNIPPGTYTGATISLSNPEVVIVDPVTKLPKKLTATLTSPNTVVTFNSPITIGGNTTVLNFDLNLQNSITIDAGNTTATITPQFTVTASSLPANAENENEDNGEVDDLRGVITALNSPKFTLQVPQLANPITIVTDSNTRFKDGVSSFAGLAVNMIVTVEGMTQSDGSVLAKEVESETETADGGEVEGIITAVNCASATSCPSGGNPATQLTLTAQKSSATGTAAAFPTHGASVTVAIVGGTKFAVKSRKLVGPFPAFDAADIGNAQRVEVDSENETDDTPTSVKGDKIKLTEQALVGTVSGLSGNTFTLTVGSNSAFALLTGKTTLTVQTQNATEIKNVTVANGNVVRVRGLLFVNGGNYTMIAARILQP
jgi:hypothetical protein